jgi:hypothetical protein
MVLIKKTANTFLYGIYRLVFVTAETVRQKHTGII